MGIAKLKTGIPGFDLITDGGLPEGRTTLVAGTAGSAKTVFAVQVLVEAIREGGSGVFVTFEESPTDIIENAASMGWPIQEWIDAGRWVFVDGSPQPGDERMFSGAFDFGALMARIEHAVKKCGAKRVSLDSLGAIFTQFEDSSTVRTELFRIARGLKELGLTAVLTAERTEDYGEIARFGVEEFVADNVIILRNALEDEKRRRTIEVLKYRGTTHQKGEYPFTMVDQQGIVVIPLSAIELDQPSSTERISSGSTELDEMCGDGFFQHSVILVSGATGTGKTLTSTHFINGALETGGKALLFAFEESRDQMLRNAQGWGFDLETMEREGRLKVVCAYPESASLEDHLIRIHAEIEEFKPQRVALDSLSALERVGSKKGFREFVLSVTSAMKKNEIAGMFTSATTTLLGGTSVTEAHISTITDTIILLRYAEIFGSMRRGITVLKMRGSRHDKQIREFTIDERGMHIGSPFRDVAGILSGNPVMVRRSESERLDDLFTDED